ncbi:MAG: hypothetical protein QXH24_07565 [Candidatus Bathyarchaeia archaeon]
MMLVILAGIHGSGKTTVARILSKSRRDIKIVTLDNASTFRFLFGKILGRTSFFTFSEIVTLLGMILSILKLRILTLLYYKNSLFLEHEGYLVKALAFQYYAFPIFKKIYKGSIPKSLYTVVNLSTRIAIKYLSSSYVVVIFLRLHSDVSKMREEKVGIKYRSFYLRLLAETYDVIYKMLDSNGIKVFMFDVSRNPYNVAEAILKTLLALKYDYKKT